MESKALEVQQSVQFREVQVQVHLEMIKVQVWNFHQKYCQVDASEAPFGFIKSL